MQTKLRSVIEMSVAMWIRLRFATLAIGLLTILSSNSHCAQEGNLAVASPAPRDSGPSAVDYDAYVKPLLRERCYACHGALKQEASLRLDTAAHMLAGGDSGPAIVASQAAESLLLARVAADEIADRMPPEHEGEAFSTEQIEQLRLWIDQGAIAPPDEVAEADPKQHWSFQPIVRPAVPASDANSWGKNEIDAFLARRHAEEQLAPQPEAARLVLLRRLYVDLIGLPPTREEMLLWEDDQASGWYERAVELLLNDARYGERWGRHWMDIWRYSDWWGLGEQLRNSQQHMWHWRDWIIEALNRDMPYDEMVRLMLAADELLPTDPQQLRATGFLARNFFLFNRNQWMDETVEHVSKGFLGITMNCAKCHDHKYDPFSQVDYFRMRAFFEPYHVRLDVVPGEADLTDNGIPRAFDGWLDQPTYRFIRGEESMPDKSTVLSPQVPAFFDFSELNIEPVTLPVEAWQPGRLPWVLEAKLEKAQQEATAAEEKAVELKAKISAAELANSQAADQANDQLQASTPNDGAQTQVGESEIEPVLVDDFQTWNLEKWRTFGGTWKHSPGQLEQLADESQTAHLRAQVEPPDDFEAKFRFTILSGTPYRSVGISFDATQPDPLAAAGSNDSQQSVYVSAFEAESKVQIATQQAGQWQYPIEARHLQKIELGREYELQVRVRGELINVALDGQPVIAWRTPLARRRGAFQLTAFTAQARFQHITLRPLAAHVDMVDPAQKAELDSLEQSKAELAITEASIAMAHAEADYLKTLIATMKNGDSAEIDDRSSDDLRIAAVRAERQWKVTSARHAVAGARMALLRATGDQAAATQQVADAEAKLAAAVEHSTANIGPDVAVTFPVGAAWTPTRFQISTSDDPTVAFQPTSTGRRTALARWITDRRNPLTARVAVNHLWTRHMGASLVPTEFDFGRKNSTPIHTDLLDWLAIELIDSGWSMKHVHRLIVTSAAYRMSSSLSGAERQLERDPDNQFWWRRISTRLESQVVRDAILAHAGTLDATVGGPSVMPNEQADSKRRSMYFFHSNNERNLFLSSFDEARVQECYRREQSIVPQQALALSNSRLVLDAAQLIASRLSERIGDEHSDDTSPNDNTAAEQQDFAQDDVQFIKLCFESLLAIEPNDAEVKAGLRAMHEWRQLNNASPQDIRARLVWALLNHNDFVTLR